MLGESCVDVGDNGSLLQFSSFVPQCFFVSGQLCYGKLTVMLVNSFSYLCMQLNCKLLISWQLLLYDTLYIFYPQISCSI
jgi:hypothetical protein